MQEWLRAAARVRDRRSSQRSADVRRNPGRDNDLLDLASNDYLGLAGDPRPAAAAHQAIDRFGTGARASRIVTGTTASHVEVEEELAQLTGQPTGLVFSSGYTANIGILTALGGPRTLIIRDEHGHASHIDGARLSRSPVQVCPHSDLETLEQQLRDRSEPRAIVVIESIYSVLGDAADIARAAELCAEYDALLVVDEAHGIGVAGAGRGAVHAAGLAGADHVVVTATLSKALGAQGGAVLGSELVRDQVVNAAKTFLFDTGLAPAAAAAAAEACRIIAAEPDRVARIADIAARIATAAGIEQAPGAVQAIPIGPPDKTVAIAQRLHEDGVAVGCFRPPSVPDGISRIRLTARATVDPERAVATAAAVAEWAREL